MYETNQLRANEEEGFITAVVKLGHNHGSTQYAAELIKPERRNLLASQVGEPVVRAQRVVAQKLVGGKVQVVGSVFGDDV